MEYCILFLEGVITFISPCLLPMLPIYVSFFAGGTHGGNRRKTLGNALGFVLGFTLVFVLLGVLAGGAGRFLAKYQTAVNIVSGVVVVVFGLHFMGLLRISVLNRSLQLNAETKNLGFWSSVLFGVVFSVGWTPCVGAFLGSALMLAVQQGSAGKGVWLLLCYSAGLGVPFILSAILIDRLKTAFDWIKSHYRTINTISGAFLVLVGVMMAAGLMQRLLSALSF